MGQKVNPIGLRLGIIKTWESQWFGGKNYANYIFEDQKLRKFVKQKLYHAGISRIEIERSAKRSRLRIFTARPGIVIGKKGAEIAQLKKEIEKLTVQEVLIDIQEVRKPEIDAQLVAENVATAARAARRLPARHEGGRAIRAMRFGALGVKVHLRGPARWGGDRPHGVVPRRPRPAAHPSGRHRLRHCRSAHDLRGDRGQGHDLQGRGPAPEDPAPPAEQS